MESAQLQAWRRAANNGDATAMFDVGECYFYGKHGARKDETQAAAWYRKAAEQGHAEALGSLGHCYEYGLGVPEDHRQAFAWFRKGSNAGSSWAAKRLGDCYDQGVGVDEDEDQAMLWYRKAADMGSSEAMTSIGFFYFKGRSVAQDPSQSLHWFKRAAALGDSEATYKLGLMHEHGNGTPVNLPLALSLCKQALALGKDSKRAIVRIEAAIAALPQPVSAGPRTPTPTPARVPTPNKPPTLVPAPATAPVPAVPAPAPTNAPAPAPVPVPTAAPSPAPTTASAPAAAQSPAPSKPNSAAARAAVQRRRNGQDHAIVSAELAQTWTPTAVNLLDCPVCLKPIPRNASVLLAACLHGLCRTCAAQMIEREVPFPCPVCQVPAAPMDHPLHPLIEAELARHDRHECTKCADEGDAIPAVVHCTACDCLLCDDHMRVHRKSAKLSAHELTLVAPAGTAPLCPAHDLPFEAYCASDGCHTVICAKCLTSTHPMGVHQTRLLDEAAVAATRASVTDASAAARRSVATMVEHAADAALCARDLGGRSDALIAEVHRAIDVLVATLELRRAALCAEVEDRARTERAALVALQQADEYAWRLATSAAEIAEQVAEQPIQALFHLEPAATARATTVVAAAVAASEVVPTLATLRLDLGDADRYLARLGRIVVAD